MAALDATKTLLGEYPILGTVDENEAEDTVLDSFHWALSQPLSAESEGQDRIKIKAGSRPRITVPNMKPRAYEISWNYELTVDSIRKIVVGYVVDTSGINITDRSDLIDSK